MTQRTAWKIPLAFAFVAIMTLVGCAAAPEPPVVERAWAKAADSGMTAVFADITNTGSEPVTIVGGRSEAAQQVELHEVVDGVMREKPGGVVVPPDSTRVLEPGADHIMLMGLAGPLLPGDSVLVTLELDTGEPLEVVAEVRDYAGAMEEYEPGDEGQMP